MKLRNGKEYIVTTYSEGGLTFEISYLIMPGARAQCEENADDDWNFVEQTLTCELCNEEVIDVKYAGCCKDGLCPHNIDSMCTYCGEWDKENEVWLCHTVAVATCVSV